MATAKDSFDVAQESIPNWLTPEFIENHLKVHFEDNQLKILSFELKPNSNKGIGLLSLRYRANVTFNVCKSGTNHVLSRDLMIKAAISDAASLDAMLQYDVYNKEIEFYGQIVPKIGQKLLEIGEPQLVAECFGVCRTNNVVIMEDLSMKGYGILPAQRGFNLLESKAILKRLATFHAVSAVLQQEHPNIFCNFKSGRLSRDIDAFNDLYMGNVDAALEMMDKWPDFEKYTTKLHRIRDDMVERWRKTYDVIPDQFNTLNHDDLFSPNLMLNLTEHSEGVAFRNVIFVDFQFAYWSSPTTDLHFFLNTSLMEDERPDRFDELVEHYHGHLVNILQRLNYTKHFPTLAEFFEQYRERYFTAFVASCIVLPLLAYDTEQSAFDELVRNDENAMNCKRRIFQGEKVQQLLRKNIPYFDKLGIFD